MITWAVGHLVGLAEPDAYDPKLKKWRFADLPILPRPASSSSFPTTSARRSSCGPSTASWPTTRSSDIINACDAGREGELIFAYVYDTAEVKKPVRRLWLSSMTKSAISEAFTLLRDGDEMKPLEAAARSRSEADWLVGMNATRAASIRLRAAFDGAVSLGRVQTPTLALVARREEEIRRLQARALLARRGALRGERRAWLRRPLPGRQAPAGRGGRREDRRGLQRPARRDHEAREEGGARAPAAALRPHEPPAPRQHALRLLRAAHAGAAQRLYEEHKALTYPRTNSRFLTGDMIPEIKPTASLVGHNPQYRRGSEYVLALDKLPLERVVNDKKVTDHHAIIPTRSEHDLGRMGQDELKVYDLVAKRFLAIFHPEAVYERTRVETTVAEHIFRTSGRRLVEPGWKAVYGEEADQPRADDDSGGDQLLPKLEQGESVETNSVESMRKETQPPRRFTDASLLGAMETAGKDVEDAEVREAMKDSGIGTPATRAAIIERLVDVGLHRARGPRAGGHREGRSR